MSWLEQRQRAIAAGFAAATGHQHHAHVMQTETDRVAMVERAGYRPVGHYFIMVNRSSKPLPIYRLPAGIELRPVVPEHYRAIWDAPIRVFTSHWATRRRASAATKPG